MVVVYEKDEVNLDAAQNLHVEVNLGALQVADSGAAVVVAQGHVRGLGRPPSAHLGYQPVSAFAITGAVVVGFAVVVVLCSHSAVDCCCVNCPPLPPVARRVLPETLGKL